MNLPHFAHIFVHRMGEATGTLLSVEDELGSMFRVGGSAPKRAVSRCSVNTRYLLDLAVLFSELLRRSWFFLTRSLSFSLSKGSKFNNALLGPSGFGVEIIGMMGLQSPVTSSLAFVWLTCTVRRSGAPQTVPPACRS